MILTRKDILGLKDIKKTEIEAILNTAELMKYILKQGNKKTPHLQGKSVIILFYENSTRTKLSFELAGKYMGASVANISVSTSSVAKGESLIDTGRTIDVMGADVVVIRHPISGAPHLLARHVKASVINAGDGMNEHPTQSLLDLFTIKEKKGGFEGLKVAIIGDIYHSRVARSNIWSMVKLGCEVSVCGPNTLLPPDLEKTGVNVYNNVEDAIRGADVVMGLRIQKERQRSGLLPSIDEYARYFGINEKNIKLAKKDVLIMHPGPVNRGVEMTSIIVDEDRSAITEQVTNGVAVRMALLYMLTRRSVPDESIV
ncbi:MAG TPA: aspartate carbamoyltransferase catalytic subunit [Clostridiales bacterium]|nr:aspartate carbamoyltransferase catalytic subunit [Clostridiales bacterium]